MKTEEARLIEEYGSDDTLAMVCVRGTDYIIIVENLDGTRFELRADSFMDAREKAASLTEGK